MQEVLGATQQVSHLRDSLRVAYEEAMARNAELTRSHQKDSESNKELTLSIRSSLNALLTEDVANLSESLQGFGGSLVRDVVCYVMQNILSMVFSNGLPKFCP